jgi:hypothetical protein
MVGTVGNKSEKYVPPMRVPLIAWQAPNVTPGAGVLEPSELTQLQDIILAKVDLQNLETRFSFLQLKKTYGIRGTSARRRICIFTMVAVEFW